MGEIVKGPPNLERVHCMSITNQTFQNKIVDWAPHDHEIVVLQRRLRYLLWRHYDDIYDGSEDEGDLLKSGFFDDVIDRRTMINTLNCVPAR